MKYLSSRTEIASALNFSEYPVLMIDLDNRPNAERHPESDYANGCKVRVAWDHKNPKYVNMTSRCTLYLYNGRYGLSQEACCLHEGFGRHDVLEDAEWAMTQVIHKGQKVIVIEDRSLSRTCSVRMMRVSDKIDIHCSTVAFLEDVDD